MELVPDADAPGARVAAARKVPGSSPGGGGGGGGGWGALQAAAHEDDPPGVGGWVYLVGVASRVQVRAVSLLPWVQGGALHSPTMLACGGLN